MMICTRKVSENPRNGEIFPEWTSWYAVLHARTVSGVEVCLAVQRTVLSGYFHFGNNHFLAQLILFENVLEMFIDRRDFHAEQGGHRLLREPYRVIADDRLNRAEVLRQRVCDVFQLFLCHSGVYVRRGVRVLRGQLMPAARRPNALKHTAVVQR